LGLHYACPPVVGSVEEILSRQADIFYRLGHCFQLDEPPLFIAGRIIGYLGRTNTHKMFRNVMGKYVWDLIYRQEVMPFLRKIAGQGPTQQGMTTSPDGFLCNPYMTVRTT
jgi:hypothetical protein